MITKLELKNFRLHQQLSLNFNKKIVILSGNNAVGKTSILESIYLIATTKSHRTITDTEIITDQNEFCAIKLLNNQQEFRMVISKVGKSIFLNDVSKKRISDYLGALKVIMFSPEDLNLIKGSPSDRRLFIDFELSLIDQGYLKLLTKYKKLIKHRNALLKTLKINDDLTLLNLLNDDLIELNISIKEKRINLIEQINQLLAKNRLNLDFLVQISYKPSISDEKLKNHYLNNQKVDILQQTTTVGIHRDDYLIEINGLSAKVYASQGQQRLITVLIKLALLEYIKNQTQDPVILLLDDILSELDVVNQKKLINNIKVADQVFITTATKLEFDQNQVQYITLKEQ